MINIFGKGTHPTLKNSVVFEGGKHGIFVGEDAHADIVQSEIHDIGIYIFIFQFKSSLLLC